MARKELVDFLKQCQARKISLERTKKELVKKGWSAEDVDEALKVVKPLKITEAPLKPPAPPLKVPIIAKPTITGLTLGQKIKGFITDPINTFKAVKEESLGTAFKYYALLSLILALLTGLISTFAGLVMMPPGITLPPWFEAATGFGAIFLLIAFLLYIFSLAAIWVGGLLIHLGVLIFVRPNKGLKETYKALMYGATPMLLFGWIPIIGYLVPVWAIVLEIIGVKGLHETSTGRAIIAVLFIPIIAMILALISSLIFYFFRVQPYREEIVTQACLQSIILRDQALLRGEKIGPPLNCLTQKIKISKPNEVFIKQEIANAMYSCWDMLGEKNFFMRKPTMREPSLCVICATIEFDKNVQSKLPEISGINEYLFRTNIPQKGITYWDYLTGGKTLEAFTLKTNKKYAIIYSLNEKSIETKFNGGNLLREMPPEDEYKVIFGLIPLDADTVKEWGCVNLESIP